MNLIARHADRTVASAAQRAGPGFHLARFFAVASLVALVLAAAALLYFVRQQDDFHKEMRREQTAYFAQVQDSFGKRQEETARRDLLTVHEAGNINLTRVFANALWMNDFAPFVAKVQRIPIDQCRVIADVKDAGGKTVQPGEKRACYARIGKQISALPEFRALDAKVFDTMQKSTVFKIKVYDLRGITVYSSEHNQIGEDKLGNAGWQSAVAGKPVSELVHRDKFSAFEGVVENRDLIASYLPVLVLGGGTIVGVFEIYSDVTPFLDQIKNTASQIRKLSAENQALLERAAAGNEAKVDRNANLLLTIVLGLLALLYGALFLIVRHGQRIIDKQDIERQHAEAALLHSNQRFRDLVDSTDGVVWEADAATFDFSFVSNNAERVFGYPAADWLRPDFWVSHIHPEDRDRAVRYCVACTNRSEDHEFEYRFIAQDGRVVWLRDLVKVVEEAGKPRWLRGLMVDITEGKRAEAARALLEAQLRESQKMEAIGTLAGGIAHDFNNVLATILGNVELARQDASAYPLALESLEEIHKAAARARDLVRQILAFSRRQPTERKPTALAPVVAGSVRLLRAALPARLALDVHCDTAVPDVLADAIQIEQVVINLATNAMQAIPSGPGRIGIRLDMVTLDAALVQAHPVLHTMHAKRPGRTVRLAVSDDGPGMDADMRGRIFEPFFTTKKVGEGTGLGLSVVHGIVQSHEGAVVVDSQPGKGATFTVYLPAAAAQARAPEPRDSAAAATATPDVSGGQHILYVDDDESLVLLVRRLLERRGYRISGYTDPREALSALRADPAGFDLVVTDYNMPGISGLDVAREVREIRADLPVAIASGFVDEGLCAQAAGAGVRELIFKANAVEDFCEVVRRLSQAVAEKSKSS